MAKIISCSIDVTKIKKEKLFIGKNGAKYLNFQVFVNDEKDVYENDCSIAENQTKEERERGDKKNYLGNGKTVWEGRRGNVPITGAVSPASSAPPDDDLPF